MGEGLGVRARPSGASVWWESPLNGPTTSGAYVALVSIDRDTGRMTIERFVVVDDCGVVVNPLLVLGQRHGALAQGLGEGAFERMVYDEDGQVLSASLLDYALPTASSIPDWTMGQAVTPSPINALGRQGHRRGRPDRRPADAGERRAGRPGAARRHRDPPAAPRREALARHPHRRRARPAGRRSHARAFGSIYVQPGIVDVGRQEVVDNDDQVVVH